MFGFESFDSIDEADHYLFHLPRYQVIDMSNTTTGSNVFVTVGTTKFDKLIEAITSKVGLDWMVSRGYRSLKIQYGKGKKPSVESNGLQIAIEAYDFLPSLDDDMCKADLIISHAGAGTVMEALRLQKKLIVVINTMLMNNHQEELAGAMAERGHLLMVEKPENLDDNQTWVSFNDFEPTVYEGGDQDSFATLLDSHLGFARKKSD